MSTLATLVLMLFVLALLGVLPAWTFSPSGIVSVLLVTVVLALALGGAPVPH